MESISEFVAVEVKEEPIDNKVSSTTQQPSLVDSMSDHSEDPLSQCDEIGIKKEDDVCIKDEPVEDLDPLSTSTTFVPTLKARPRSTRVKSDFASYSKKKRQAVGGPPPTPPKFSEHQHDSTCTKMPTPPSSAASPHPAARGTLQKGDDDSDCKEKWQQLRSNFMREKKKFDALPSGSATVKARKWVFYDAMTFLTPCVTPRATSSNVSSPLEEMNTELDAEGEGATLDDTDNKGSASTASNVNANEKQTSSSAIKQPSSTPKNKGAYKKRRGNLEHDDVDEQLMGELRKMREQAVSKEKEESDSDRLFLLSLLPLMKQLSPMDNLDAKIEIQQIFRRKLAANKKSSYGYSTASQPATSARETPSRHAYAQPAPYAYETQAPYAYETTSPYASQRTSPVCHETSLLHDLDTPAFD